MPLRGDRLRQAREEKRLTQRELAELCGITLYQVSRYENGKSDITATSLELLARQLGVTTDYLLGLSHSANSQAGDNNLSEEEYTVLETFRHEGWTGIIRLGVAHLPK